MSCRVVLVLGVRECNHFPVILTSLYRWIIGAWTFGYSRSVHQRRTPGSAISVRCPFSLVMLLAVRLSDARRVVNPRDLKSVLMDTVAEHQLAIERFEVRVRHLQKPVGE